MNTGTRDPHVRISIFYEDRDHGRPYELTVPDRRTVHQRFNDLTDPEPVPIATNCASDIQSDAPVVVLHTPLDSRQAENALITTIAYAE